MRFRSVVLLGMLPVVIAAIVGASLVTANVLEGSARDDLSAGLIRARDGFGELVALRRRLFSAQIRVTADEPRLKAVVATPDASRDTVLDVAQELARALASDRFVLVDADGHLRIDVARPAASGDDLSADPVVARTLREGHGDGLWIAGDRVFEMEGQTLAFGDTEVGALLVGYEIDARLVADFTHQSGCLLVVHAGGRRVAGSPHPSGRDLDAAVARVPLGDASPTELDIDDVRYLAIAAPYPATNAPNLRFTVMRSLDDVLAPSRRLVRLVQLIGAIAMIIATLVAVSVARWLGRPLERLVAFTRRIASGDLQARIVPAGAREVTALANEMNRMSAQLAELVAERSRKELLESELDLAKRMQIAILPRRLDIEGLELVARMMPATEVGGDYYDIVPIPGGCWIAVGDVAGHGLNAGLVMWMTQSAMAALINTHPNASPAELIPRLNEVLYENIRNRLARDEHVTLMLLRYSNDGRLQFAGAHEEIIICRAGTGKSELVPITGTWVGAMPDVRAVTADNELALQSGDIVVLYTDGLIEAMDALHRQFGVQRVCASVERRRAEPVAQILDGIFEDLAGFTARANDDVTVLVFRYTEFPRF